MLKLGKIVWFFIILFCLFFIGWRFANAQEVKNIKKSIKVARESLIETSNLTSSMISNSVIPKGINEHLELLNEDLAKYEDVLKIIKTKDELEATVTRVSMICHRVNNLNKALEILSPNIRNTINLHLKAFRKSLEEIVIIHLNLATISTKDGRVDFVKMENKDFASFYLSLANYNNDWKKNYEY